MNHIAKTALFSSIFFALTIFSGCASSDGAKKTHTQFCKEKFDKAEELYKKEKYGRVIDKLEEIMSSYWLNFVKYGNPNGKDTFGKELPLWQTTNQSDGLLMEFGDSCQMIKDPFGYIYDYLN